MEKETDLKQNGPVVLFNVDRKGRLADYAACHSDRECGASLRGCLKIHLRISDINRMRQSVSPD